MATVRYWFNEFKRGRTTIFEEERPGHPSDLFTKKIVKNVNDMVFGDRRKCSLAIGVPNGRAIKLLKIGLRWVPCLLEKDNVRVQITTSKKFFGSFKKNLQDFLH